MCLAIFAKEYGRAHIGHGPLGPAFLITISSPGAQLLLCLLKPVFVICLLHVSHVLMFGLLFTILVQHFRWFFSVPFVSNVWLQSLHVNFIFLLDFSCILFLCDIRPALDLQIFPQSSYVHVRSSSSGCCTFLSPLSPCELCPAKLSYSCMFLTLSFTVAFQIVLS